MAVSTRERAPGTLLPAPELDLRRAARVGLVGGAAVAFVGAVGMVAAFSGRMIVSPLTLSYALLGVLGFGSGYVAAQPPPRLEGYEESRPGLRNVLAGLIAGALTGAVAALFVLVAAVFDSREIFVQFTDRLVHVMTLGAGSGIGLVLLPALGAALGALGGLLRLPSERIRRSIFAAVMWTLIIGLLQVLSLQILQGVKLGWLADALFRGSAAGLEPAAAPLLALLIFGLRYALGRKRTRTARDRFTSLEGGRKRIAAVALLAIALVVLGALPQILGNFLSAALVQGGIFLLMALGLNIVIGFAGLLDLGYVAFFAVGAYTTAVLSSPTSPAYSPELIFWQAIPFVILAAAVAGLIVGTPVLRMRGDYLAIVTLGFGEIARLIAQSEWHEATLGGAQGITRVPAINIGPLDVGGFRVFPDMSFVGSEQFFYLIFAFALLFAYITFALQNSRIGRAWNAMREDESVAEAMGVNIVTAKLTAFAMGAIMAGLGGALFAHRVTAVFPHSFNIQVSIIVVVLVIVGGMGSVPGVIVSAMALIALPELLREFAEFRFLIYGILLIYMMLQRPEGLVPSRRRQRELHEDERGQDAWLRAEADRQEAEATKETGGT